MHELDLSLKGAFRDHYMTCDLFIPRQTNLFVDSKTVAELGFKLRAVVAKKFDIKFGKKFGKTNRVIGNTIVRLLTIR